jgi:hypothetical protein
MTGMASILDREAGPYIWDWQETSGGRTISLHLLDAEALYVMKLDGEWLTELDGLLPHDAAISDAREELRNILADGEDENRPRSKFVMPALNTFGLGGY